MTDTQRESKQLLHIVFGGELESLDGAVFKDEPDVVRALLDAGADPDLGSPTARETAAMFGRPDLFG